MSERLVIDPVRCTAAGLCAELLPEGIGLDEWGYPVIDERPVPRRFVAMARRAAAECPRRAVHLVRATEQPG